MTSPDCTPDINEPPTIAGYYWWRKSPTRQWQLALVAGGGTIAEFFGGETMNAPLWGQWMPAEVVELEVGL